MMLSQPVLTHFPRTQTELLYGLHSVPSVTWIMANTLAVGNVCISICSFGQLVRSHLWFFEFDGHRQFIEKKKKAKKHSFWKYLTEKSLAYCQTADYNKPRLHSFSLKLTSECGKRHKVLIFVFVCIIHSHHTILAFYDRKKCFGLRVLDYHLFAELNISRLENAKILLCCIVVMIMTNSKI